MQRQSRLDAVHTDVPRLPIEAHQVEQPSASLTAPLLTLEHSPVLAVALLPGGTATAVPFGLQTVSAVRVHCEIVLCPAPQVLQGSHGAVALGFRLA